MKDYLDLVSKNFSLGSLKYNVNLIEDIFSLDLNALDLLDSSLISKYIAALSQYLIYLTFQLNRTKAEYYVYSNRLEKQLLLKLDTVKASSIKEKRAKLISEDRELINLDRDCEVLKAEIHLLEGLSNPIELYINALKKELNRRWNERELSKN